MLFFFFFQAEDGIRDVAVTGVQTCALPISARRRVGVAHGSSSSYARRARRSRRGSARQSSPRTVPRPPRSGSRAPPAPDRKSTRLNSSHGYISYAVFCLKKKKTQITAYPPL